MKKIFMLLAILLLSSKAYSLENVIGISAGYSATQTTTQHFIDSTYKNPAYAEWLALSDEEKEDTKKHPKPTEFLQNSLNQIKESFSNGGIFSLEYQARLTNRIVLAVNLENTTAKVNTKYQNINLTTNSTEINFLSLFPIFKTQSFTFRGGIGAGLGYGLIKNNSKDTIANQSYNNSFYPLIDLLADAEYAVSNNVMLFTRATMKFGGMMLKSNKYATNSISPAQQDFANNNEVVSIDKNNINIAQSFTTNISVGIRYKL